MRSTGWPITLSWSIGLVVAGLSNLMILSPRLRQHRAKRALDQRQLECVLARRLGIGEEPRRNGLGAARQLRLGRPDAPWLVSDAAERHASGAVALHDGADRDQREGIGRAVADLAI